MASLPSCLIVTDAAKQGVIDVLTAYRGEPYGFSRQLIAADAVDPSPLTPATHWLSFDNSTTDDVVSAMLAFASGDLPPLADVEAAWGENGLIGAVSAMEAISGASLQVAAVSGDITPMDFVLAFVAAKGLMLKPEPEV